MEKIQSAIAKARAARTRTSGAAAGGTVAAVPVETRLTPAAAPASTAVNPAAHVAEAAAPGESDLSPTRIPEAWAALPILVPKAKRLRRNRIVAFDSGRDAAPFDMIRTRLLQQMRANNWRRLAITSPGTGCGKSTLTLNLAFSLGRQPDQRTLVAEMDMRRPSLAKYIGITAQHNFAKVLEGTAAFADNAQRYGTNLAFATHHGTVRNAAELLQSTRTGEVLDRIVADYAPTVMIFDMPPMLGSDDVMAFASRVDCVLLVAAAEATTIKQVDTCERELASQTNVLGVVLNKCRYMGNEDSYGYYG